MVKPALEILHENNLRVGLCSRGVGKIKHLDQFLQLGNATRKLVFNAKDADIFIGWGNKASGQKAVELARQTGRPFLLLEDAFVRSYAPQIVAGKQGLGIVLDDCGIYYDASQPSRLENLIKENGSDATANENGGKIIAHLARSQICKYNNYDTDDVKLTSDLRRNGFVLVVDQTWRDQSVSGAGGDDHSFTKMIEAAIDENPGQKIVVKLHPEVLAGKKRGYLKDLAVKHGCTLLSANINPWQLFAYVSAVYTVSSQLGFDALMAGCKVRCFAMPFYAGWGLTGDETTCARRVGVNPTIAGIADAALSQYARYIDAYDAGGSDVFKAVDQLGQIRDAYNQNRKLAAFYQVTPWKWKRVKQMFRPTANDRTFFLTQKGAIKAAVARGGDVVVWSSRVEESLDEACARQNVNLQRLEDGFIRSVGLGTNFHLPMSLIVDDQGIYYDPNRPSQLEHILEHQVFDGPDIERAGCLIKTIIEEEITKYNVQTGQADFPLPDDQTIILVPGQVDDDASIRLGGDNMTGQDLLDAVRHASPEAFIVFKPHPDVISGQRPGLCDQKTVETMADIYAPDIPIERMIEFCDEVHTISSLTGFEALIRGKKVVCYGLPFYAGWGLTTDLKPCKRRSRKLSVEMLVAGTLIKYPRYYDPVAELPCGPEQIIKRIQQQRENPTSPSLLIRCRSAFGKLRSRLR